MHIPACRLLAAYKYRGKTYRFVVNGRTGSVRGNAPIPRVRSPLRFDQYDIYIVPGSSGYFMALQNDQIDTFTDHSKGAIVLPCFPPDPVDEAVITRHRSKPPRLCGRGAMRSRGS